MKRFAVLFASLAVLSAAAPAGAVADTGDLTDHCKRLPLPVPLCR